MLLLIWHLCPNWNFGFIWFIRKRCLWFTIVVRHPPNELISEHDNLQPHCCCYHNKNWFVLVRWFWFSPAFFHSIKFKIVLNCFPELISEYANLATLKNCWNKCYVLFWTTDLFSNFPFQAQFRKMMLNRLSFLARSSKCLHTLLSSVKNTGPVSAKRCVHRNSRTYCQFSDLPGGVSTSQRLKTGLLWATTVSGLLLYGQLYNPLIRPLKTAACKRIDGSNQPRPLRPNTAAELELFKAIRSKDIQKVEAIIQSKQVDINMRHTLG